ncbi:MAG: DUF167 domain-containing protein [Planctomycetota bacterium]|nr:DUF167 domain-containing protein [Planctomycetota bacterium]
MSAAPRIWKASDGATRLLVRAQPGASRAGLAGLWNEHLKVAVRAPADEGRANEELVLTLAGALGLRPKEVRLVRGEKAREKEFEIALEPEELRRRLLERLAEA